MDTPRSAPWNPDRQWADPFIATLILIILALLSAQAQFRRPGPRPLPDQVSLQGRLQDLALAAPKLMGSLGSRAMAPRSVAAAARDVGPGWDQALMAIHAGESGEGNLGLQLAQAAPGKLGQSFQQAYRRCYVDPAATPAPLPAEVAALRRALGGGYGARILEARLLSRAGGDGAKLEAAARDWALPRLLLLGLGTTFGLLLGLAGLGFGLFLALTRGQREPYPSYGMSGRALLIVLLGWFLTLMAASPAIGLLVSLLPFLRPVALPLVYALHAGLGLFYLCRAEGVDLPTLWRRLAPAHHGRAAASGLGFFALAFASVMAVALLLSPLLRHHSPQKELLDHLAGLQGFPALILVFLTVAVAAPFFEEVLFRGFLLPWLGERLSTRLGPRRGWATALAVTALAFGAMHMQPWGLPTLSTLGFVLGLAYLRTGNLLASILVHGLWNGGVFILMRLFS